MPTTRESQGVPGTSGQQQESTVRKQQHIAMRRGSGSNTTTTTTTLPSPSRHYIQFFPMDNDHDVSLYRGRHHQHQQRYTFYYEPYQSTQQRRHRQQQRHSSKSSSPLFPSLPSSSSASPTSSFNSFCPNNEPLIFHSDVMDDTAIFDDFNQLAADQDTFIPSSSPSTTVIDDDFVLFP